MGARASPAALHQALVDQLRARGDLGDPRLEAAFRAVARHLFLPDVPTDVAYLDDAVPVKYDQDGMVLSSASQPSMIAAMLRQLRLRPGDNVLEIGAGTGYSAALMRHVVGERGAVTSIELDPDLAAMAADNLRRVSLPGRVRVVCGDGALGDPSHAPYDRIIAAVGIWDVPAAWVRQLKANGIVVAPLWLDSLQVSAAFHRRPRGALLSWHNLPCGFVRLRGVDAGPGLSRRVGATSLLLTANDVDTFDASALERWLSEPVLEDSLGESLSSADYWHGFLPYLMLHIPPGFHLALYNVLDDPPLAHLDGNGFALVARDGACLVPYRLEGRAIAIGGTSALLALQSLRAAWAREGRPDARSLRLRLTPLRDDVPEQRRGRVYRRAYHDVRVWMEAEAKSDDR